MKGRVALIATAILATLIGFVWFVAGPDPDVGAADLRRIPVLVEEETTRPGAVGITRPTGERSALAEAVEVLSTAAEPAHMPPASEGHTDGVRLLVATADGVPIAGARVDLLRGNSVTPVETEASDVGGRATLARADVGDRLVVVAEGYATSRTVLPARPWPEPMVVVLLRGNRWLGGVVVDDQGVPVANVEVTMQSLSSVFEARTDDAGRFAFTGTHAGPPPEAVIEIRSADHCFPAGGLDLPWSTWIEIGWPRLVVHRWARVDLVVEDAAGVAVDDATVVLRHPPELKELEDAVGWLPGGPTVGLPCRAEPDPSDGRPRYALEIPPGYPWWIEIEQGSIGHERSYLGGLAPGERIARTVRLAGVARPTQQAFVVMDDRGAPVAGATAIVAVRRVRSENRSYERADALGRFEIDTPGYDWTVTVRANGFAGWERSFPAGPVSPEPVEVVLEASDVGIDVVVEDGDGNGIGGVRVSIWLEGDGATADQVANEVTDAAGVLAWRGLDPNRAHRVQVGAGTPGAYVLEPDAGAAATDLVPSPLVHRGVRAGGTRIVFRMVPPGSISGIVEANEVEGSRLVLSAWEDGRADGTPAFGQSVVLGGDGRFAFVGLPPGHYRLWGDRLGSTLRSPSSAVELTPGKHVGDVVLRRR